jgi:CTP:molybdopterin cytidylyltransferase MocA
MIGAVILAAGRGSRMGSPKALLPLPGTTLLGHQLSQLPAASIALVIPEGPSCLVATGLQDPRVREVPNEQVDLGPYLSLKLGLGALPREADPIFVVPVDCPLDPALPQAMLNALAANPAWDFMVPALGQPPARSGHPVLLRGRLRQPLLALPDTHRLDQALALHRGGHLPWTGPLPYLNLNCPEDHQRLLDLLARETPKEHP